MQSRIEKAVLVLRAITLLPNSAYRHLFREALAFVRTLPQRLEQPLPVAMNDLGTGDKTMLREKNVRLLCDVAALLERRSVPGICLRRALTRYHFLRRNGLPLTIIFGAKHTDNIPENGLSGHAWVTLNGIIYHEHPQDVEPFVEMFRWPVDSER